MSKFSYPEINPKLVYLSSKIKYMAALFVFHSVKKYKQLYMYIHTGIKYNSSSHKCVLYTVQNIQGIMLVVYAIFH